MILVRAVVEVTFVHSVSLTPLYYDVLKVAVMIHDKAFF